MIVGYTTGVFDLFHVGHLNLLRNARGLCDRLIVGVSTDDLVAKIKSKSCTIPYCDRVEIVRGCRYVDAAVPQADLDKHAGWQKLRFNVLFVGDDWFGTEPWLEQERRLAEQSVKIIYLPYTHGVSSTQLQQQVTTAKS